MWHSTPLFLFNTHSLIYPGAVIAQSAAEEEYSLSFSQAAGRVSCPREFMCVAALWGSLARSTQTAIGRTKANVTHEEDHFGFNRVMSQGSHTQGVPQNVHTHGMIINSSGLDMKRKKHQVSYQLWSVYAFWGDTLYIRVKIVDCSCNLHKHIVCLDV